MAVTRVQYNCCSCIVLSYANHTRQNVARETRSIYSVLSSFVNTVIIMYDTIRYDTIYYLH